MEQKDNPIAEVDFEEAKKLADLISIAQDLGSVMKTCSKLKVLLEDNSRDSLLIENLWTSALIRYARCFASGKRYGLDETIFEDLQGEALKVHNMYMNLRNKHIAHSVNPFEQIKVGVVLSPEESQDKKIIGVATLLMKQISLDREGVHQLGLLSKVILEKVREMAKQYEQKTLEISKTFPIKDLYKCARPRLVAPGLDETNKSRR